MRKRRAQPAWPQPKQERTRVLVEHTDEATGVSAKLALERAGYEVQWCGGPDHLPRHRCPLAAGLGCELAAQADVVVHALNPDRSEHRCVLSALREQHPDLPVVVEIPAPKVARHAELLAGCTIVPTPMTRSTLLEAVAKAPSSESAEPPSSFIPSG